MSVRGCYQGVTGFKEAEIRLRENNQDFTYLTRESDIKKGKFLLSWLSKDGSVKHTTALNPSAKNHFKKLEEAMPVIEKMVLSNDECVHPIPPRDCNTSDENNNSMDFELPSVHSCYACDFVGGHIRELNDHQRKHTVKECPHCNKFILYTSHRNHVIKCQKTLPEVHSCEQCYFETPWSYALRRHMTIHERDHKSDICTKTYKDEETLQRHKETHCGDEFKCDECDKTFHSLYARTRHRKDHHRMIRSGENFMMLDIEHMANTSPPDPGPHHKCHDPGCGYVADRKERLNQHILNRHKSVPRPRKVYRCDGCTYMTSHFRVHLLTCLKHQELHPRVVPILTKKQLVKIKNQSSISDRKFIKLLQEIEKEAGQRLFEGNLEKELRESIDSWKDFYEVKEVDILDKQGNTMKSSLAWVKDLNGLISAIIKETNIQQPRVVVGGDSGQGKFIFTLSVLDMADLGKDCDGYSRSGKRRTLVIAASDDCNESHENINLILSHLKINELEILDWILTGDLKFANLCFGIQAHGCTHNCVYCDGSRWHNGKETTKAEGEWRPGEMRTGERNMGNRARWLMRWSGKATARLHLGKFKNCEHPHISLPDGKEKIEVIFLFPPDPLHCILLGVLDTRVKA